MQTPELYHQRFLHETEGSTGRCSVREKHWKHFPQPNQQQSTIVFEFVSRKCSGRRWTTSMQQTGVGQ